jgi:hypothetical protein
MRIWGEEGKIWKNGGREDSKEELDKGPEVFG